MTDTKGIPKAHSEPLIPQDALSPQKTNESTASSAADSSPFLDTTTTPESPSLMPVNSLSRNQSFSDISSYQEEWETPMETLTVFDLLDNLALPATLEKWQNRISAQRERVRRQREKLKSSTANAKDRVVEEWRRRVPTPDERLDKYTRRMRSSIDRLGKRWNDTKAVTAREKFSFIAGVLNIFISGYLIGALPQYFYMWFTAQFCYFMPVRYYTYRQKGYHYFLADMCYFVNFLLILTIWGAPQSKRLFIATYCLANGNNAVAIAMWRNSLVFHSLDKVTSLFIHIMPPVTLHCMLHLTPPAMQKVRFPGIYAIKFSSPDDPIHYSLLSMVIWSSVPYAIWQISYHFLISVRRADKIAAGRPTSFTWLRKSYGNSWIGKLVLGLPESLQEPGFMVTQYLYALGSMIPCPIWLWFRWPSALFLLSLFTWSVYNGATYYIDVFGKRFQRELEQMKKDVAKWQISPEGFTSPPMTPKASEDGPHLHHSKSDSVGGQSSRSNDNHIDKIPLLDANSEKVNTSAANGADTSGLRERKS